MKVTLIFLVSFMFLQGCSSSKEAAVGETIQVINATFNEWYEQPQAHSDIPERGTDLKLTVRNWPEAYSPLYIVYNKRKSLSAIVTDSTANFTVIKGRTVRTSALMQETSERVNISDRLVFTNAEGEKGYIEITDWKRAEESE